MKNKAFYEPFGFWITGFALLFGSLASGKIGGPAAPGGVPALNGHEFSIAGFGLFYGDTSQLVARLISAVVCIVWALGSAYIFFRLQNLVMPLRSSREDELEGLDVPEMGVAAYPEFQLHGALSSKGCHIV